MTLTTLALLIIAALVAFAVLRFVFQSATIVIIVIVGLILIGGVSLDQVLNKGSELFGDAKRVACPKTPQEGRVKLRQANQQLAAVKKQLTNQNLAQQQRDNLNLKKTTLEAQIKRLQVCLND